MLEYCFRIIKFCIFCIIIFINSCINVNDNYINNNIFELKDFYPITNYFVDTINNITHDFEADKLIYIDYNNAIDGIIIPSSKQVDDKGFIFEFKIKNKSNYRKSTSKDKLYTVNNMTNIYNIVYLKITFYLTFF